MIVPNKIVRIRVTYFHFYFNIQSFSIKHAVEPARFNVVEPARFNVGLHLEQNRWRTKMLPSIKVFMHAKKILMADRLMMLPMHGWQLIVR